MLFDFQSVGAHHSQLPLPDGRGLFREEQEQLVD